MIGYSSGLGRSIYIVFGPFLNIAVLIYATIYMDSFGWGKTRKVVAGAALDTSESELERLEKGSSMATEEVVVSVTPEDLTCPLLDAGSTPRRDVGEEESSLGH